MPIRVDNACILSYTAFWLCKASDTARRLIENQAVQTLQKMMDSGSAWQQRSRFKNRDQPEIQSSNLGKHDSRANLLSSRSPEETSQEVTHNLIKPEKADLNDLFLEHGQMLDLRVLQYTDEAVGRNMATKLLKASLLSKQI